MTISEQNNIDELWQSFSGKVIKEDTSFILNGNKLKMHLKPNINPTKQGVRIQFHVDGEIGGNELATLTTGLQKVLNKALSQYGMSVNEDPDVPRGQGQVIGFYLTVEQLESFIKKALKEALKSTSTKVNTQKDGDKEK